MLQALYFSPPFREHIQGSLALARPPDSSSKQSTASSSLPSKPASASAPAQSAGKQTLANAFSGHRKRESASIDVAEEAKSTKLSLDTAVTPTAGPSSSTISPAALTGQPLPELDLSPSQTTLYTTLRDLFASITAHPNKSGVVAPSAFVSQLKRENELFRSTMHQDAHEFLNYLLNAIAEEVEKAMKAKAPQIAPPLGKPFAKSGRIRCFAKEILPLRCECITGPATTPSTWVHRLFEGVLTNETRCLTCETVSISATRDLTALTYARAGHEQGRIVLRLVHRHRREHLFDFLSAPI